MATISFRLNGEDRQIEALPDEPLIFVEVALTRGMAPSIQPLIDLASVPADPGQADTAVFYSISNCLEGLRNISFGAFLIKQVVHELQSEEPGVKHFVTLSPIPGFRDWLTAQTQPVPEAKEPLLRACARYLTSRRADGRACDPVATNGGRANWRPRHLIVKSCFRSWSRSLGQRFRR